MSRPVAFTASGVEFKKFPKWGMYMGVQQGKHGKGTVLFVNICYDTDGTTETGPEMYEGTDDDGNVHEEYDVNEMEYLEENSEILDDINEEFGTNFMTSDFNA